MSHTISRLTGIAHRNGWNIKTITYSNGDSGGFIATRPDAAITITTSRRGRIIDIKHTAYPFQKILFDKAGIAADWFTN